MIPELGQLSLILALCVALVQAIFPLWGAAKKNDAFMSLARPAASITFALLFVAYLLLSWSFYVNDFSVSYVAHQSNSMLPLFYRMGAVWGGHEGSLLLWVLMLAGWAGCVAWLSRSLDLAMVARVIGVLGLVMVGLLAFVIFTSNPFDRLFPVPAEGRDLNPLLQDPGLIFHPPLLYMGYVGLAVAFAFAIASLLAGKLDAAWVRWSRPWTTIAWVFLTLGIALGSLWAYYELGWGGWWFWDPVENASFMPWLVATALIHSLAVTEKRGAFKNWTVLLAIAAFSLSLLGTFLVRSGVLTSVHAFATDPSRGVFILILLALVVGSSLTLFAMRAGAVAKGGHFALFSRETLILLGNIALVVATASVLLGTLYPLILDSLNMGKISVGPPYFDAVFVPVMIPAMILIAATPFAHWKEAKWSVMARKLVMPAVLGLLFALVTPFVMGSGNFMTGLGLFLAGFITGSILQQIIPTLRSGRPGMSFWAQQLGHLGVAVFAVGVTMVSTWEEEKDVRMEPGQTVTVGGYTFKMIGLEQTPGPNYSATRGTFEAVPTRGGDVLNLYPEKRQYFSSTMPMTEADIDYGWTRDIYVSLGEPLEDGKAWAVRVYYKPFVSWIWGGCVVMSLGGLLAVIDRRYRKLLKSVHSSASAKVTA